MLIGTTSILVRRECFACSDHLDHFSDVEALIIVDTNRMAGPERTSRKEQNGGQSAPATVYLAD